MDTYTGGELNFWEESEEEGDRGGVDEESCRGSTLAEDFHPQCAAQLMGGQRWKLASQHKLWTGDAVIYSAGPENVHSVSPYSPNGSHRYQILVWYRKDDKFQSPEHRAVRQFLRANKLPELVRFSHELIVHGILFFITPKGGVGHRNIPQEYSKHSIDQRTLQNIGLSTIETRKLLRALRTAVNY